MPQASFVVLEDRGILAVSGPDSRAFLQGLVSNDVEKVSPDRAVYAALLTAQGKYLHDFIMAGTGDAIWLDAEAARLADLKRRLSMYRLRAKVAIDDLPDLAVAVQPLRTSQIRRLTIIMTKLKSSARRNRIMVSKKCWIGN